jgi:hypothetical protein
MGEKPQISYARSKNIFRKGPWNCRSLGFARDDKGMGNGSIKSGCWIETSAAGKLPRASANKHRRAPSTPHQKACVCDRSAKRFAQDDGFVGGLESSWLVMQKTRKDRKVTGSRDDKGEGGGATTSSGCSQLLCSVTLNLSWFDLLLTLQHLHMHPFRKISKLKAI